MADAGFTVRAGTLASGSTQMAGLEGQCEQLAGLVTAALGVLAGAAGNSGVESAARGLALSAVKQFLGAGAGYQYTAAGLASTAATYSRAEDSAAASVPGVTPWPAGAS